MTQYIMNAKSTKTMNFSNMKSGTRTYKVTASELFAGRKDRCAVSIKVRGREVGMVTFEVVNEQVRKMAQNGAVTPFDLIEAMCLAKRALKAA